MIKTTREYKEDVMLEISQTHSGNKDHEMQLLIAAKLTELCELMKAKTVV